MNDSNGTKKDLQIAPHEGRELEYVANGIKPLALLNRNKQPEQYGRAMDLQHVLVIRRQGNDEISITSKANEKLHDVYELLVSSRAAVVIRSAAEKHRMLGRLFGYSEEQIDAFIKADMKCACGQCSFNDTNGKQNQLDEFLEADTTAYTKKPRIKLKTMYRNKWLNPVTGEDLTPVTAEEVAERESFT